MSAADGHDTRSPFGAGELAQVHPQLPAWTNKGTQKRAIKAQNTIHDQPHPNPAKTKIPKYARQKTERSIREDGQQDLIAGFGSIELEQENCQPHTQHGNSEQNHEEPAFYPQAGWNQRPSSEVSDKVLV